MSVKVEEMMTKSVITAQPHQSVEHVRNMLEKNSISAVPVVDSDGHPVGIVSSTDLVRELKPSSPISQIMTEKVYTVPQCDDNRLPARVVRNRKIPRAAAPISISGRWASAWRASTRRGKPTAKLVMPAITSCRTCCTQKCCPAPRRARV